jgi:hypothetical protein
MSRFERRLGGLKSDGSPRPGIANCKLPSRQSIMLDEIEKKNNILNTNPSSVINDITNKNENILKKLQITRNPTERILLNHELRLNTMELNVDCLNNLEENPNNTEFYQEKIALQEQTIAELHLRVAAFEKKIEMLLKTNEANEENVEKIVMDISDVVKDEKIKSMNEESYENDSPTFE